MSNSTKIMELQRILSEVKDEPVTAGEVYNEYAEKSTIDICNDMAGLIETLQELKNIAFS